MVKYIFRFTAHQTHRQDNMRETEFYNEAPRERDRDPVEI